MNTGFSQTELSDAVSAAARDMGFSDTAVRSITSRHYAAGSNVMTAFQQVRHEQMIDNDKIRASRPCVHIRPVLTKNQQERLIACNPYVEIKFIPSRSIMVPHALANAQKRIDDFMLMQQILDINVTNGHIMDIGGNYMTHVKNRDPRFHSCMKPVGVQDAIRANTRDARLIASMGDFSELSRVKDQNIILHTLGKSQKPEDGSLYEFYVNNNPEGGWGCEHEAIDCNCGVYQAAIMNHVYDVTLEYLVDVMVKHNMSRVDGVIHGKLDMLVNRESCEVYEGTMTEIDLQYIVNLRDDTIICTFLDDAALTYIHKFSEYKRYLIDCYICSRDGYDYYYNVMQRNGASIIYRIVKVLALPFSHGMSKKYLYSRFKKPYTKLNGWFLSESFNGRIMSTYDGLEYMPKLFPSEVMDMVEQKAHELLKGSVSMESIISQIRTWSTYISVNGVPVQGEIPVSDVDYHYLAANIIAKAIYDEHINQAVIKLKLSTELKMRDVREAGTFKLMYEAFVKNNLVLLSKVSSSTKDVLRAFLCKHRNLSVITVEKVNEEYAFANRANPVETHSTPRSVMRLNTPDLSAVFLGLTAGVPELMNIVAPKAHEMMPPDLADKYISIHFDRIKAVDIDKHKSDLMQFEVGEERAEDSLAIDTLIEKGHVRSSNARANYEYRMQSIKEAIVYYESAINDVYTYVRVTVDKLGVEKGVGHIRQALLLQETRKTPDLWQVTNERITGRSTRGHDLKLFKYMCVYDIQQKTFKHVEVNTDRSRVITEVIIPGVLSGWVFVDDSLEVFTSPRVVEAMRMALDTTYEEYFDYQIQFCVAITGSGKTTTIAGNAKYHDLVVCPTRNCRNDNYYSMQDRGTMADPKHQVRTCDSLLIWAIENKDVLSKHDFLFGDEVGLTHQGQFHAICMLFRIRRFFAFWDPWQILWRPRTSDVVMVKVRLGTIQKYVFKWISYRFTADACAAVNRMYENRVRTVKKTTNTIVYLPNQSPTLPRDISGRLLCCTHFEKDAAVRAGYTQTLTVNEFQGDEEEDVFFFMLHPRSIPLYNDEEFIVSLYGRFKRGLTIYQVGADRNGFVKAYERSVMPYNREHSQDLSTAGLSYHD